MKKLMTKTTDNITRVVGLDIEQIRQLTPEEEEQIVIKRSGSPVSYPHKKRLGRIGRGNPLLARYKVRTLSDLEHKSKKLFGI